MKLEVGKRYVTRGNAEASVDIEHGTLEGGPLTLTGRVSLAKGGTYYAVTWDVHGNCIGIGGDKERRYNFDLIAEMNENEEVTSDEAGPDQLVEVIQNLLALVDTPLGRRLIRGNFADEVRKDAKEKLAKYNT